MKKILMTGVTGFVGGSVMRELLRLGMPVIAGVRKNSRLVPCTVKYKKVSSTKMSKMSKKVSGLAFCL